MSDYITHLVAQTVPPPFILSHPTRAMRVLEGMTFHEPAGVAAELQRAVAPAASHRLYVTYDQTAGRKDLDRLWTPVPMLAGHGVGLSMFLSPTLGRGQAGSLAILADVAAGVNPPLLASELHGPLGSRPAAETAIRTAMLADFHTEATVYDGVADSRGLADFLPPATEFMRERWRGRAGALAIGGAIGAELHSATGYMTMGLADRAASVAVALGLSAAGLDGVAMTPFEEVMVILVLACWQERAWTEVGDRKLLTAEIHRWRQPGVGPRVREAMRASVDRLMTFPLAVEGRPPIDIEGWRASVVHPTDNGVTFDEMWGSHHPSVAAP